MNAELPMKQRLDVQDIVNINPGELEHGTRDIKLEICSDERERGFEDLNPVVQQENCKNKARDESDILNEIVKECKRLSDEHNGQTESLQRSMKKENEDVVVEIDPSDVSVKCEQFNLNVENEPDRILPDTDGGCNFSEADLTTQFCESSDYWQPSSISSSDDGGTKDFQRKLGKNPKSRFKETDFSKRRLKRPLAQSSSSHSDIEIVSPKALKSTQALQTMHSVRENDGIPTKSSQTRNKMVSDKGSEDLSPQDGHPSKSNGTTSSGNTCECTVALKKVLQQLKIIKKTVDSNSYLLKKIVNSSKKTVTVSLPKQFGHLPKRSVEELENLSSLCENPSERQELVAFMTTIGGLDVRHAINNILFKIITNDLALTVNMSGANGKFRFGRSSILTAIFESVTLSFENQPLTQHQVGRIVAKWLRGAIDRCGGRERRRKAKLEKEKHKE